MNNRRKSIVVPPSQLENGTSITTTRKEEHRELSSELLKTEQEITLMLSKIDKNLSRSYSIIQESLIPIVTKYKNASIDIRKNATWWRHFFEIGANVELATSDDKPQREIVPEEINSSYDTEGNTMEFQKRYTDNFTNEFHTANPLFPKQQETQHSQFDSSELPVPMTNVSASNTITREVTYTSPRKRQRVADPETPDKRKSLIAAKFDSSPIQPPELDDDSPPVTIHFATVEEVQKKTKEEMAKDITSDKLGKLLDSDIE